jgi:hypothetical protein
VNQFIEECRREWRRLRVPKSVADDMAAELETDLTEAATEGVNPEELVGSDARSFARSWAAERGSPRLNQKKRLVVAVVVVLVCVAVVGATLAIRAAPSRATAKPVTLATLALPPPSGTGPVRVIASPAGVPVVLREELSRDSTRTVGFILLAAGLGGAVAVTGVSLSTGRRQALRF